MDNYSGIYSQLGNFLHTNGFMCEFEKKITELNLEAGLYAQRKGRSIRIFPYGDYLFVNIGNFLSVETGKLNEKHQQARKYVDSMYKWPRSMRFTVPNIASILISKDGFTDEIRKLAQKRTRSIIGGEIHGIYLLDLERLEFTSQGINYTFVPVPVGTQMEFKDVDPQNRMYYLINSMAEWIFNNACKII